MSSLPTSEFPLSDAIVDGFPSSDDDADYAIQTRIASDMESAERLQPALETDPLLSSTSWKMRNRARRELYPNLRAAEAGGWLMPLLRRLRWNAARQETRWVKILSDMILQALRKTTQLAEVEFTSLAEVVAEMHKVSRGLCLADLARKIEAFERGGDTSDGVIRGIRTLRE